MIAPEAGAGIKKQAGRTVLLRNNLLVSILIFAVLEWWRPCFFLTDDNLDGSLPFFTEMGQRLLHGQSPFYSDHLFGGHYNLLRDISYLSWNPIFLLASLLAGTPFHLAIVDVDAFAFFMLTTAGFVNLAWYLRRELSLPVSDGWIMFYTMSFTYSVMVLTTGASWLNFMGNQSALPWLTLGILQKNWRPGIGLIALFTVHQILGGHPSPLVSSTLFLSLFALAVSITRRSILPLGCWAIGYTLAVIVVSPFLVPAIQGFGLSYRSMGVTLEDMQQYNIPLKSFSISLFFGMSFWLFKLPDNPTTAYTTYTLALGSTAAIWCLPFALSSRVKWSSLEVICLGMMALIGITVCRPLWITEIMLHLPVLKSMRWPFRELLQFLFFLHLFLLLRPPGLTQTLQKIGACFGASLLLVSLSLYPLPPTFNSMKMDRQLLFSGGTSRYWDKVRPLLKPTDRVAVLIPEKLYSDDRFQEPYSLLGTYDYAILAGITNVSGYSLSTPKDQFFTKTFPFYPFGAFVPEQKAALLKEKPGLKFITLENLQPLKITLSSGDGPTLDLTPFIPAEIRNQ